MTSSTKQVFFFGEGCCPGACEAAIALVRACDSILTPVCHAGELLKKGPGQWRVAGIALSQQQQPPLQSQQQQQSSQLGGPPPPSQHGRRLPAGSVAGLGKRLGQASSSQQQPQRRRYGQQLHQGSSQQSQLEDEGADGGGNVPPDAPFAFW